MPRGLLSGRGLRAAARAVKKTAENISAASAVALSQAAEAGGACPKMNVGGQAVIEGVMMRGPKRWAVTVRKADGGMECREVGYAGWAKKRPILGKPVIRGAVVLLESLVLGLRALNFSAEIAARDDFSNAEGPGKTPGAVEPLSKDAPQADNEPQTAGSSSAAKTSADASGAGITKAPPALGFWAMAGTIAAAFGMAVLLFVALPHYLSFWAGDVWNFNDTSPLFHLIDGLLKFAFFIAYVWGIGLIPDIKRVYAYHGAEHQAIYTFEAGEELTPEMAARHPLAHPRCGTAFIFLVLALSILFFAAIFPIVFNSSGGGFLRALWGVLLKIVLMFPLAGLAYEVTRRAGQAGPGSIWRVMLWPGLILQKLTTRMPDNAQLEVALTSLKKVISPN